MTHSSRRTQSYFKDEFLYSCNAFPRCNSFRKRCSLSVIHLKVRVLHEKCYVVKEKDFAVEADVNNNKPSYISSRDSFPCVNVCILQSGKDGTLSETDRGILQCYRQHYSTEAVIFVINREVTNMQYCSILSRNINNELKLEKNCNDVLHRLFPIQSDGISIRISMLFEKQMIGRIDSPSIDLPDSELKYIKDQNELDLRYHQLKCVSSINKMICEFGLENENLFVAIEDHSKVSEVSEYLHTFLRHVQNIKIQPFEKIDVVDLSVKSGDKVANASQVFGTVGLSLIDGDNQYCATCTHVVQKCLGKFDISIPKHDSNLIIIDTENARFATNEIFTPSSSIDFSAVKLVRTDIPLSSSLRNRHDVSVNGKLFGRDRLLLRPGTELYKWGATTDLTTGTFKGVSEQDDKSYHITVDSTNCFAKEGDSGSLICYSDEESEIAVFILKGRIDDIKRRKSSGSEEKHQNSQEQFKGKYQKFYVYRLADIMKLCRHELSGIKECIGTDD